MVEIEAQKYTILIVDDIVESLDFLISLLEENGYQTTFAIDGKRAIESVKKTKPELILLDLRMPVMDGLECCQILKADPTYQDIPIIFLTVSKEEENLAEAFELGAVDYITKPFKQQELLIIIKHELTISQQKKEIEEKKLALELANEKLRDFNSMVCHDLKNYSNNIVTLTELLKIKSFSKFEPKEQEIFELIYQAGYQITNIIDSLRILSDIKRRKYIKYEKVNLSEIVQQI